MEQIKCALHQPPNRSEFSKSGIYCICHENSGKCYVGSSVNTYNRICTHRRKLIQGEHDNEHLQNAFDKYGIESFCVNLLEFCKESDLVKREIFWIEYNNCMDRESGYNKSFVSITRRNKYTRESRIKMSKSHMGNKKVIMLSKNKDVLKKFDSLYEAAEYVKANDKSKSSEFIIKQRISQSARGVTVSTGNRNKAKRFSAYGYLWRIK